MRRRTELIRRWTLGGVLFGAAFPIAGWVLASGGLSPTQIVAAHDSQSVMWIVDLAPLVLGIAGRLIGKEYANVDAAFRATDQKVKERTAELREANDRLESLMRSKDQFVATVSHEVRNPLTVVLGFADELRDALWARGDSECAELAELIGDQSREINNIIEDLLVAARAEVGVMTLVPLAVDLGNEVRTVVRGCVCAKDVREAIELDIEAALVWADPSRVRQIIRNLLTNAIRYGGSAITVRVRSDGSRVSVCVCDDGSGIPDDQREAVFEAYEQGKTDTPISGSVGLGLNVSRLLARMMDGDLTYRYERGISTFELSLPAHDVDEGTNSASEMLSV
jgi:signal transduction histidine kinase